MTDIRALIADDAFAASFQSLGQYRTALLAALAQPEPQGPTDKELWDLYQDLGRDFSPTEFARTVLARYGRPAIEPVPVSKRLPGPEDCDAEGRCWWWDDDDDMWRLSEHRPWLPAWWTHWLPRWALTVPGVEGEQ